MARPPDVLAAIVRDKRREVAEAKRAAPLAELRAKARDSEPKRGFEARVRDFVDQDLPAVICELKKASPSRGVMRKRYDPAQIARSYEAGGAACLSVLTDAPYFQGSLDHLREAREACSLPVLRKDFMVDPYQVYESAANGADCVLLIVSALEPRQLSDLAHLARELGMDVLVETHEERELSAALQLPSGLIGINNRDLRTFETDLATSLRLRKSVPDDRVAVAESGIHERADVDRLMGAGLRCFLVGEAFMRENEPGRKLSELFFAVPAARAAASS